ncbi:MAG: mechanosensitive ion channel family protein [Bacteroidales bacterium]|nr:mechanosensitive ion channel family protein [Bacteroidales bacterium]MCF8405461.1 mechanosensitive ion channel family protein [Bacteroidales bacterium]
MFSNIETSLQSWLNTIGLSDANAKITTDFVAFFVLIIFSLLTFYVARKIFIVLIHRLTAKSKTNWDDVLASQKFFKLMAYLVPSYIIYAFTPYVLEPYTKIVSGIQSIVNIYMIAVVLLIINAFLNSVAIIYQDFQVAKTKPIKGYVQVIKIIVYLIGAIIILSTLFHKNPLGLIGGLGAFSAVLLLVFKDPIMGFVGGIQLSANNMLVPGDWISMPKYDADGTVIDVALTTVKVQNWDKTISTIPTYSLISDSFKNWRGMEESGGRRIKRSINIDMKSIRFCTDAMLAKFSKFEHVKEYVDKTEKNLSEYNKSHNIDDSILVNGRRQTNIGIFRAYLGGYLHNLNEIHDEMTFLVRQLQPTDKGLPIEIYVFSKIQEWAKYEDLQSDIFDHILAVVPEFDLRIYQNPTGDDLQKVLGSFNKEA